jgi:phosphoglycerol transferase
MLTEKTTTERPWVRNAAAYAVVVVLAVAVLIQLMDLRRAHLTTPFGYDGDALFTQVQVRSMLDHGWFLHNPDIGAPFGSELYDFPLPESLHFAVLKGLGWLGCNYVLAINLYYLLTFPLTAVTAYFVLRHFGRGRLVALVAGLLYAFLPYHFMRGTHNLFLSAYYLVPLMVMLVLWVYLEPGLLFQRAGTEARRFHPFSRRVLAALAVCVLMGGAGVYYAFFGCFFLMVTGLFAMTATRRLQPLLDGAFFAGIIVVVGLINLAPHLQYTHDNGSNPLIQRRFIEAEMFGLRVTQLLLPVPDHRMTEMRDLRARYDREQLHYEINTPGLGVIGSAGFLLLLVRLFHRRPLTAEPTQESGLVLLNGTGLLLATTGSFGALLALAVSPAIRGYTRMCVFLAFFAVFMLALFYEQMMASFGRFALARWVLRGSLLAVLVLGLYDQAAPGVCFPRYQAQTVWPHIENDKAFVRAIEARLPAGAMVFQLPHVYYPEFGSTARFHDYDHFRVYLVSKTLRWSYGAMKGRSAGFWQETVAGMPLERMLSTLVYAGFSGVYVARAGFDDDAHQLEANLRDLLRVEPLQSADGRMLFFDLRAYGNSLRAGLSAEELQVRRDLALHPLTLTWSKEFADEERSPSGRWRWCCAPCGEIYLTNDTSRPRQAVVRLTLAAPRPAAAMKVESPLGVVELVSDSISGGEQYLHLTLPPGKHCIRLSCDGPVQRFENDPRLLYFRVIDCSLTEAD